MKIDRTNCSKPQASKRLATTLTIAVGFFGCRNAADEKAQFVPAAVEQTPAPRPLPTKIPVMRFPPRYEAELKKDIKAHLEMWRRSIEARSVEKHLEHYADRIENYYNASNVDKTLVRDDRRRAFERFDTLLIELINAEVYLESKDAATVVLDKGWNFKRGDSFSNGLVQQEIRLRRIENHWLIISEKDLEVYRKDEG